MRNGLFLLLLFLSTSLFSQQLPQISQYLRNQYMINPGAAGVYDFTDITLGGRVQWLGMADAPKTSYLSISAPLSHFSSKNQYNPSLRNSSGFSKSPVVNTGRLKHAVGLQFLANQLGAFRRLDFAGTYAIHLPISRGYNISFGTNLGLLNHTFLPERAVVEDLVSDNAYLNFVANNTHLNILNISSGLYFYSKKMFVGLSVNQLTKGLVYFGSGFYDARMHFNFTAGYKINIGTDYSITPSTLIKYMVPTVPVVESSVQLEYQESFWLAISYRHKDAFIGMFGMNLSDRFKFGYSFDYTISDLNQFSSGGHELILGIMLGR